MPPQKRKKIKSDEQIIEEVKLKELGIFINDKEYKDNEQG